MQGDAPEDPAQMEDAEIARELRDIAERLDDVGSEIAATGPAWLHPAMDEATATNLLHAKGGDGTEITPVYFLIEGPHHTPGDGAGEFWYRAHTLSYTPAGNLEAPPELYMEDDILPWTTDYSTDGHPVAAGYSHRGTIFDSIFDLGRTVYGNRSVYEPVVEPTANRTIQALRAATDTLVERRAALSAEVSSVVNVLVVGGDRLRTPESIEAVGVPRRIAGSVVADFIAERVGLRAPDRARVYLMDGSSYQVVPTATPYAEFKRMVQESAATPPLLQIIEYDHARLDADAAATAPDRKRRRPGLEGAVPIYAVGADISPDDPRQLSVWMLADNAGLVVVDADTGAAACAHVFEDGVAALCAEQREHGYACHRCYQDLIAAEA